MRPNPTFPAIGPRALAAPFLVALILFPASKAPAQGEQGRICEVAPALKCLDKAVLDGATLKVPLDAMAVRKDGFVICDSSFNYTASPDFVLIMDNTGSMDSNAVKDGIPRYCDALRPEPEDPECISGDPRSLRGPALQTFLDSAVVKGGKGMNVGILTFSSTVLHNSGRLLPLNEATVDSIKGTIEMIPGGLTNYTEVLRAAYDLLATSSKPKSRKFIIFVSDGRPNRPKPIDGGPYRYKEFLDGEIAVHGIFLGANTENFKDMQDISAATGGLSFQIREVELLAGILTNDIAERLFSRATPTSSRVANLSYSPAVAFDVDADGHLPAADSGSYTLRLPGPVRLRQGENKMLVRTDYEHGSAVQEVRFTIERTATGPYDSLVRTCRDPATLRLFKNDETTALNFRGLPYLLADSTMRYGLTTTADIDSFDMDIQVSGPATAGRDREIVPNGPASREDSVWSGSLPFEHQSAGKRPGDGTLQADHGEYVIAAYRHPFIPEDSAVARVRIKYGPDHDQASYHDLDGDGRIETVRIRWLEELGALPEKLAFTIVDPAGTHERIAAGEEIRFAAGSGGGEDRQGVVVTLEDPFPRGVTSVANADSSGRTFRQPSIPLMDGRFRVDDSAAPVIVKAEVRGPDREHPLARVIVTYSEPVSIADASVEPVVFKRDTVIFSATEIPIARIEKLGEREWAFHLTAGAPFKPVGGDSAAINDNGDTRDLSGKAPATLVFQSVTGGNPVQSISGFYVTFPNGSRSDARAADVVSRDGNGFIPVDSRGNPIPGDAYGKCETCNPGREGSFGGAVIHLITKAPMDYELSIFTNLGEPVTRAAGKITEEDLKLLERIEPADGSDDPNEARYVQRIVWTGYSRKGHAVGTGVYVMRAVFKYGKNFKTGAKAAVDTRITRFGFMRQCCRSVVEWYE